ncbi:MAG: hypothetical protein IPG89_07360 [Bacteroidetes bacterium]|nr:hypothetical protein [Bacteroidota bacterium]
MKALLIGRVHLKNADNGILVISNYQEGKSVNYKLTYGGTSSCSGTNLSGTAKLVSSNKAVSGVEVDSQTTLELSGNKIVFFPTMEDVGMECQKFFDSDFIRTK